MRHLGTVFGLTLVSRGLGFLRDIVMAAVLGAGPLADAFMLAFRIPNHFRAIFAEGAFNAAFLPTFAATRSRDGPEAAARLQATVLFWLLAANLALLAFVLAAPETFLGALGPGLAEQPDQRALVVALTRITFPYLLCMSLVAYLSALLNAQDRFTASSAAPILLNLCMLAGLGSAQLFPSAAHAAAWSVLIAGLAQVLLLVVAAARAGCRLHPGWPRRDPASARFFRRLLPALASSGALQIAVLADTIFATFLPVGALTHLYYADRLYQLPIGLVGISIGTVLLPAIARAAGAGDSAAMRAAADRALRVCLILGMPLMVFLALFGDWIMALLFVRGAFGAAEAAAAAQVLAAYSLGLLPALMLRSLVACFHGRGDMRTPLLALCAATVLNLALKVVLIGPLGTSGLALATAAGLWVYVGLLYAMARRGGHLDLTPGTALGIAAPMLVLAPLLWALRQGLPRVLPETAAMLAGLAAAAALLAAVAAWQMARARR